MSKVRVLLCAAALTAMTSIAHGETWSVIEGPGGKVSGVWNVKIIGTEITGDALMTTAEHTTLRYNFSGRVDGRNWTINRIKPSDNNLCTYSGTSSSAGNPRKVAEITGSAMCQQKTGVWKVHAVPTGK